MPSRSGHGAVRSHPVWHVLEAEQVARRLGVDPSRGLSEAEAKARLARRGRNVLREQRRRSPLAMLLAQFGDFMILVLLGAAVIAGVVGELQDSAVILVIVILNALFGFAQEYRAERAIAALKAMAAVSAKVLRDGQSQRLPAADIVPGDVVLLEAGDVVPADLRLIEAVRLKVEEAPLTGESVAVDKGKRALEAADLQLGDRRNMAYKGTTVGYGRGRGLTVATGMDTELGRIASLLQEDVALKTPLQLRLAQFGRRLAYAALAICGIVFAVGLLRGEPLVLMFLTAVSLAVAAIPEALAGRRDDLARAGRAQDGQAARAGAAPAGGGNAGFRHLHLLRQDRHADTRPHAAWSGICRRGTNPRLVRARRAGALAQPVPRRRAVQRRAARTA